ncbi:MAG: hypothetical protein ACR2ND_01960 [Solirubrobacteraceae bacterium]
MPPRTQRAAVTALAALEFGEHPGVDVERRARHGALMLSRGASDVRVHALLLSGVIAVGYLLWQPPSADLAAALYRAHVGAAPFDLSWYAGQHPLSYSVLMPLLAPAVGVRLLAALSVVCAATLFASLVPSRRAALWFAATVAISLGSGRVTFSLGVAIALGAALAAERRRVGMGGALAVLSALASPLAGAFLALALVLRHTRVALAALLPLLVLSLVYPEPGYFPFDASSFWPALAATLTLFVLVRGLELRATLVLYALVLIGAAVIHSALGGNAARFGALLAGPIALLCLSRRRALVVLLPLFAYWALQAPVRDVVRAGGDPSVEAAYYAPLLGFLHRLPGPFRIEIPFTASHWEAYRVAPSFALARGWERQLDIGVNHVFYTGSIAPAAYGAWLRDHAVSYVALPDARLDYSARGEAQLIRSGQSYLTPIWVSAHWRVYAVARRAPLASSPARMTALSSGAFTLAFDAPGASEVRVRYAGGSCVSRAPAGWTIVRASRAERLRVDFDLLGARCTPLDG